MLNQCVLIGRIATDPELKFTPGGHAVSTFRIAVDRPYVNSEGSRETDFIDIVAWRQRAEFAANYLTKGRLIAVQGRLQVRTWQAQDGTNRRTTEIVANDLRALDSPKGSARSDQEEGYTPSDSRPPTLVPAGGGEDETPGFIDPFTDN